MQSAPLPKAVSGPVMLALFSDETVQERFVKFHQQFPKVYDLFSAFAIQLIQKGHKQLGGRMIIERIRWEFATGSKDEIGFKINNDFIAHYTRMFQNQHPEYKDFFETRAIRKP